MPDIILDCAGLACPSPVIKAKDLIESSCPDTFSMLVDNEAARDNVSRFLMSRGYIARSDEKEGIWTITAQKDGDAPVCEIMSDEQLAQPAAATQPPKICVFIPTDVIGTGDDELGSKLMLAFLSTLPELGEELWRVVLVNGGVRMTTPGSPCLEKIQDLEKAGVDILVCGTCLEFFDILKDKAVGETTNMLDVVTSLQLATKVIRV